MQVVIDDVLVRKLANLVKKLLKDGYFAEEERALEYVAGMIAFIKDIPDQQWYKTKNRKYGAWYCRYKPNRRTTWYFTFHEYKEQVFVLQAFNNHGPGYPAFIRGIK